jgi:uncharacterized membrane protein
MPIQVTCPSCHARFKVSDKFAGQKGPCPKCKKPITIPKLEDEVVIHAPESYGPTGVDGRATLKPITRKETKASVVLIGGIVAGIVLTLAAAFAVGQMFPDGAPKWILGIGAFLLAPPLVYAGYSFLRDQELEPYVGQTLWVRCAICAVVYAGLWGLHWYIRHMVVGTGEFELFHLMYFVPLLVIPGALASLATLDLDSVSASLHYGFYLLATVMLRILMGLSPF